MTTEERLNALESTLSDQIGIVEQLDAQLYRLRADLRGWAEEVESRLHRLTAPTG